LTQVAGLFSLTGHLHCRAFTSSHHSPSRAALFAISSPNFN
jgi:hypothetical protein